MVSRKERELEKYGEPLAYDRSFKGPLHNRSCTDVLCLFIFVIFLGAWGYISYYAYNHGDLEKLLTPTDSLNRKCGLDSDVLNKPYLFFFNLEKCIDPFTPITGCQTPQVCVEKCPDSTFIYEERNGLKQEDLSKLICIDDNDKKDLVKAKQALSNDRCAKWYVQSKPLLNRCIPSDKKGIDEVITKIPTALTLADIIEKLQISVNLEVFGQQVVQDIVESWPIIVIAIIIAVVASLLFIALMRWIAAPVLWFSIIGSLAGLGFGVYVCVNEYYYWRDNPSISQHSPNLNSQFKSILQTKSTWLYLSIIVSVVMLIILLLVIFLRKRIVIAIALVKEGSKAVSSIISSVFFPIFPWCLQILTLGFAIAVGLYLASIGEASFRIAGEDNQLNNSCMCTGSAARYKLWDVCDPKEFNDKCKEHKGTTSFNFFYGDESSPCTKVGCYFEKIQSPTMVTYFQIYNVIGFIWLAFFISAFGEMVLAATFATWYWTFHKSDVPFFTTTKAFCRTIRYHLGTLAFGSLILTICRIIRIILEYIEKKLKMYDNVFTRAILCCMKCFFYCLENFLRFLNRNAYIMCAIHGKNFCSSAKDAFNLLMRNFLRVFTLDKVTDFLFFLSKLLLTIAAGAGTYFYVEHHYEGTNKLHYSGVPTAVVVIGSYLTSSIFFGVYSMAVDTLFLCFLEDCERNDGSEEKPFYMSKQLMSILGKKNIIPRHQYR